MGKLDRDNDGDVDMGDLVHGAGEVNDALAARNNSMRTTAIVGISMFMLGVWLGAVLFGG